MKKSILTALISASLIIVSCGKSEVEQEKNITKDAVIKEEQKIVNPDTSGVTQEKLESTMIDIFKKGKDATCTFKITSEGNTFDAIMYVKGKDLRYTMSGEIEGNKMENNVIVKDGYSYSWTNMSKYGYKMKDTINDEIQEGIESNGNQEEMESEELNEKVEFDCKYSVDSSMFNLPAGINFQDLGEIPEIPMGN